MVRLVSRIDLLNKEITVSNQNTQLTKFTTLSARAKNDDLLSRTGLSADERFAVLAGGISALQLAPSQLEREWKTHP